MNDLNEFKKEVSGYSDLALRKIETNYVNDQRTSRQRLAAIRKEQKRRKKEANHASP